MNEIEFRATRIEENLKELCYQSNQPGKNTRVINSMKLFVKEAKTHLEKIEDAIIMTEGLTNYDNPEKSFTHERPAPKTLAPESGCVVNRVKED